jgi:DNA modification methylase
MPRFRLYNSDAFEWLARRRPQSIHAVVTDPPFGIIEYEPAQLRKMRNGVGGIWRLPRDYDGQKRRPSPRFTVLKSNDHEKIAAFHKRLSCQLLRVLVPGGHVIIASQNLLSHFVIEAFCNAGFEVRGQIARVVKTLRGGDRPKGAHKRFPDVSVSPRSSWEPWLIFRKPCDGVVRDNLKHWGTGALRRPSRDVPFRDLIISGPAPKRERAVAPHPSLKPQLFMMEVVRAVLPCERGIVLDPFMGSGSTIAAAESLGFRSIGLEISPRFFRVASASISSRVQMNGSVKLNGCNHKAHQNGSL